MYLRYSTWRTAVFILLCTNSVCTSVLVVFVLSTSRHFPVADRRLYIVCLSTGYLPLATFDDYFVIHMNNFTSQQIRIVIVVSNRVYHLLFTCAWSSTLRLLYNCVQRRWPVCGYITICICLVTQDKFRPSYYGILIG